MPKATFFNKLASAIRPVVKLGSILVGLAGLVLIIAWLSGFFEEKIQPGLTATTAVLKPEQPTDEVHEIFKDYIEETVGTLKAASRSVISAKTLATIETISVSAGDLVNEGDILVQLNTREMNARLQQATETLAAATATETESQNDFDRNQRLLDQKAISQREFDLSLRALDIAKANVRRAEQAIKEAEVLLSYSTIRAPKEGRVVDRLAEPGDTIQPGMPILTLYDATSLRLETPVLEQLAVDLEIGQKLMVYVDSIDAEFEATVDEIVPQADSLSRTFLVKASLPRSEKLYEGMFGRLRIPAGSRRHLCLPTDAITRIGQLEFVDVVASDQTLERRLIKTGRLGMPGKIEVLSGVQAGEQVVVHPAPPSTAGDQ